MLVLATFASPLPAAAWSADGHKVVARIAADLLAARAKNGDAASVRALAEIKELLLGASLDQVAVCPDQIRRDAGADCAGIRLPAMPQSGPWHYVKMTVSDSPSSPAAYCPEGNCVVDQINSDVAELRNPRGRFASDVTLSRQLALIFLVHFVGDEHQPMHCVHEIEGGASDNGGNKKPVVWAGAPSGELPGDDDAPDPWDSLFPLNLHSIWDMLLEPNARLDPVSLSQKLERELQDIDTAPWLSGDFVAGTAMESFEIAKTSIYPAYHRPGGNRITPDYQGQMQPIAFRRLAMAGTRLAELLRRAFAEPAPDF